MQPTLEKRKATSDFLIGESKKTGAIHHFFPYKSLNLRWMAVLGIGCLLGALGLASCNQMVKKSTQSAKKNDNARVIYPITPYSYSISKESTFLGGAVSSAHPLASMVGRNIMQRGGNAIDAAIAVQLALSVVYPCAGNIGGGGFMVVHLNDGKKLALDFRETAPAAATESMFVGENGVANTKKSQHGHLSVGVPGTVDGLFKAHAYAKLPFSELIAPAIALASKGFVITEREARLLNQNLALFTSANTASVPFLQKKQWKQGDTLVQTELAATLQRIQQQGRAGFYEGETARLITAEIQRGGGIITKEDLKNYTAKWREPHSFYFEGHEIVTMPLPSSGGILLEQMLTMSGKIPFKTWGFQQALSVHMMTEIERLAYADRARYLGDADFVKVPIAELTSGAYLAQKLKMIEPGKAGKSSEVTAVLPFEKEETTHISILDPEGNAVSVTTTLNGNYGSHTVVGGAGFLLNNEMDDFSIQPGVPNMFGAIGYAANAISPGKRMLSSMSPTIVLLHGKPVMVVGTPGGTTITTSVYQTIMNALVFKIDPYQNVQAPKFHHQWLPDILYVEKGFPHSVQDQLRAMGYQLEERSAIGRVELLWKNPDGSIRAIADRRGDDAVAGF
jgi:gamma-glutamyltranspeptidase/glutathione hydrolase